MGTLHDQIESYRYKFVDKEQWVTDTQYKEIVNVCQSLPGPTPIQILLLISTLCSKSPTVGVGALVAFCLPAAILLCLLGIFMNEFGKNYDAMPVQIRLVILGFKASGGALLFRRAIDSVQFYFNNAFTIAIVVVAAILYFLFPTSTCIEVGFLFGAIISLYIKTESKFKLSRNAKALMKNMRRYSWIFGKWAVILLIGIFAYLGFQFRVHEVATYYFVYVFYFVGCFIFGPSSTIFPILYP